MLLSGNDPVRIFRELETLGTLTVRVDTTRLPAFAALDPETCYLAWELTLQGDISHQQVSEVFAWVEGDCELSLSPLPSLQPAFEGSEGEEPKRNTAVAEVVTLDQPSPDMRQTAGATMPTPTFMSPTIT